MTFKTIQIKHFPFTVTITDEMSVTLEIGTGIHAASWEPRTHAEAVRIYSTISQVLEIVKELME